MTEINQPIEVKLGYAPENDAFALGVPDINMRIDLPNDVLPEFLNWLRGDWRERPFGNFDVVWSPRLNAALLLFSLNPQARSACVLFALSPDAWDQMVTDLHCKEEELRREFIEPFQRLLDQGVSKNDAAILLEKSKPFDLEAMWQARN